MIAIRDQFVVRIVESMWIVSSSPRHCRSRGCWIPELLDSLVTVSQNHDQPIRKMDSEELLALPAVLDTVKAGTAALNS